MPTLVLHRTGDPVVPVASARALAAAIPRAQLAEFDGCDHFQHIGDIDGWLDALEEFATGLRPRSRTAPAPRVSQPPVIRTLGGFSVEHDGRRVPLTDWGSRRARQLCKRLAAAGGAPVPRDELVEMLWPDEHADTARLSARLSVQLSTVRRILNGGVIADRSSVRLDLNAVRVDLADFDTAVYANDRPAVMELYRGPFLPEDVYDDWTRPMRARANVAGTVGPRAPSGPVGTAGPPLPGGTSGRPVLLEGRRISLHRTAFMLSRACRSFAVADAAGHW